jgi:hypothetical protein
MDDYAFVFAELAEASLYYLENTWQNYDRVVLIIDRRFDEWKRGIRPESLAATQKAKAWWKFW